MNRSAHSVRRGALVAAACLALGAGSARAQGALVLGGGGARGLAHAGVITGLEDRGWSPEFVVGTSMGAIVGSLYAAGVSPDSIWRMVRAQDWRLLFQYRALAPAPGHEPFFPLLQMGLGVDRSRYQEGLVSDFRVNRLLSELLFDASTRARNDFDRLPRAFRAVAADFAAGDVVVLGSGSLARAVRASMAVPGVFAPVPWEGMLLVDGGISNQVPADVARARGYTQIVSVDVTRPESIAADAGPLRSMMRATRLILSRAARGDPEAYILIAPDIDADRSAAVFPGDPIDLLEAGRRAGRTAPVPAHPGDTLAQPGTQPRRLTSLRVEGDAALRGLVARTFRAALGPYDPQVVAAAADALYATGLFRALWPRVDFTAGDSATLVVRAEAVPPLTIAGGVAYENDRGGRALAMLRARPGGAAFHIAASGEVDGLGALASLQAGRPLTPRPSIAVEAGARYARTDVRRFERDEPTAELAVHRSGGWIGGTWHRIDPDWVAWAGIRADHISVENGVRGASAGPYLRIGEVTTPARVVGVPKLIEVESRYGEIAYRRARVRGSLDLAVGSVRLGLLADLTATSDDAPPDALPALGDEHLVPGLAWGNARNRARGVAGIDVAWPFIFDASMRVRLRAGAAANALDALDNARWRPGADVGVTGWTPVGRLEAAVGIARDGRPRIDVVLGTGF